MKINDYSHLATTQSGAARTQEIGSAHRSGNAQKGQSASGDGDQVQLSNLSASIRAHNAESPDRTAHVARVAAAVQSGTYRVDAAAVSRGVINDAIVAR